MNTWFTSDGHFGHGNIIKYSKRPFSSVEEMDEELIQRWNEVVKDRDVVYYVGDFTLNGYSFSVKIFKRLKGRILFVPGSHDMWVDTYEFGSPPSTASQNGQVLLLDSLHSCNTIDHPDLWTPKGKLPIVLCHYAMRSWDRSHYGSWHLYGHHHGSIAPYGKSFDIGVDSHNFYPWSLDEIAEKMKLLEPIVDYSKRNN